MSARALEPLGDLVGLNEQGKAIWVDVPWIAAVVSDQTSGTTLLHLIDGQRLTVDEPHEVVVDIIQSAQVTVQ